MTSRKKAPAMTIPIAVRVDVAIADFPQLQRLAWPLATATVLTAEEALSLYERNWRHVDMAAMEPHERALLDRLVARVGKGQLLV